MKWTIFFLILLIYAPTVLPAQAQLLQIEEAGKYGYINLNGDVVIPPKYATAFHFSEGLGAVRLEDKFGFIDSTGRWQIPPIYPYDVTKKEEPDVPLEIITTFKGGINPAQFWRR